jgi:hypothetical protein
MTRPTTMTMMAEAEIARKAQNVAATTRMVVIKVIKELKVSTESMVARSDTSSSF